MEMQQDETRLRNDSGPAAGNPSVYSAAQCLLEPSENFERVYPQPWDTIPYGFAFALQLRVSSEYSGAVEFVYPL